MPRIAPATLEGNAVQTSMLARVLGRRPEILAAFGRLDAAARFHGTLSVALKEAVRAAVAEDGGCEYCRSLGAYRPNAEDRRESLAVAFARLVAQDAGAITDAQFDVLREEFDEEEIVELVAYVCFDVVAGQMFGAAMGLEAAGAEEAAAYQAVVGSRG
jgi:alkylhydroperoxidase family enzyme